MRAAHNTPLKRANCCFLKCLQSPTSYKVSTRSNHYLESSLDVTFSVHFFLLILQNKPVPGKNWVFTVERTFACKTQGHLLLTREDLTVRRQETGGGIERFHSQRSWKFNLKNSIPSLSLLLVFPLMLLALTFRSHSAVSKKWMIPSPPLERCCELFSVWKLEGYSSTSILEKPETKWSTPYLWESIQAHIKEEWKKSFERYSVNENQVSLVLGETVGVGETMTK